MNTDLFPETLLVQLESDACFTTSLKVAEHFHKRHADVLRAIENLLSMLPATYDHQRNFASMIRLDEAGKGARREQPYYRLTRSAFCLLAMRFTGAKAVQWQVDFVAAFDDMERQLAERTARYARALDQVRPNLRPVVEGTERGLRRTAIAAPLGKSTASISYHRSAARRLGLLTLKGA